MSKRIFPLLLLSILLLLSGCMAKPAAPATVPTLPVTFVPAPFPGETVPSTEAAAPETAPTAPAETAATGALPDPVPTAEPSPTLPYLQQIDRADQSVYAGPGYDYCFAGTVRERGTYTIVEEAVDHEGSLWGKLKSGIGWVNLTEIQSEDYQNAPISANFADENLLLHGAYHHYSDAQEYRIPIAFRAYGTLRDVTLFTMGYTAEGPFPGEDFFTLPEMTREMPLVAELAFPGDMTAYGIRFTDESGTAHTYTVYISGRNGALMLTEE